MKNTLFRRYQKVLDKRAMGGTLPFNELSQMGVGLIDAFDKPDNLGFQSSAGTIGKSTLSMAGTGAAIGSVLPGVGTAIGAGVGALAGLTTGIIGANKNKTRERSLRNTIGFNQLQQANQFSQSALASDPTLATGNNTQSYFANGGTMGRFVKCANGGQLGMPDRSPITDMISGGGQAKAVSSDNTVIKGNSHADGGIAIPGLDSEVEGGETTLNNFVFSKKLGFADAHRPIAKAKGIIEKKPQTLERANSLRRLKVQETDLANQQESLKAIMGLH